MMYKMAEKCRREWAGTADEEDPVLILILPL